ncbi:MAG: helix-turn-helix domain-containing protein, partial [Anaerolineae bacterium]|nr:helix-turn-helix domain-containing protein [Anaerolineae bacterium]
MNDLASEVMTVDEMAAYLRLHPLTVRAMACKGDLPVFKVGRQWRAKRDHLDAWIKNRSMENIRQSDG